MSTTIPNLDGVGVAFDDPGLVANAGLLLVATLVDRLGLETLIDDTVDLAGRVGAANPGSKLLTLMMGLVAGGSFIDHVDMLRAGDTAKILPFTVVAPSTVGTFLRAFTFGHVRQLDKTIGETIRRVWTDFGVGPGDDRLVLDLDSTVTQVYGHHKQGAANTYTKVVGYHPLVASRADTGEILHVRLREGSSQRGHGQFIRELIARVQRAGASGQILVRADSGFWSRKLIDVLDRLKCLYSITVSMNPSIRKQIQAIPETGWSPITYPDGGYAQVGSCAYVTVGKSQDHHTPLTVRLVVRRTHRIPEDDTQDTLFDDWEYHAFVTNQTGQAVDVDAEHRRHAVVELAIRDLKHGVGAFHMPSGNFSANGAWLAATVMAHNLVRWTQICGDPRPGAPIRVAATLRTQIVSVPGRLVNHARRNILRLPARWPWEQLFNRYLTNLRALPQLI